MKVQCTFDVEVLQRTHMTKMLNIGFNWFRFYFEITLKRFESQIIEPLTLYVRSLSSNSQRFRVQNSCLEACSLSMQEDENDMSLMLWQRAHRQKKKTKSFTFYGRSWYFKPHIWQAHHKNARARYLSLSPNVSDEFNAPGKYMEWFGIKRALKPIVTC